MLNDFDIIVVGAGHAGCEAALAASRMGMKTLLVTMHLDAIAQMSCNPAIGGLAKGQIVREIDALGGEMGAITDDSGLQFRMLNLSKGPAVWSPRAQCDKKLYHRLMKRILEEQPNLTLLQGEATSIQLEADKATGVFLNGGNVVRSRAVIVTTGTFLQGLIHVGLTHFSGGRYGEFSAESLSASLRLAGLELKRLKTGTPPRINGKSIDNSRMDPQFGDDSPVPFSHLTDAIRWRASKEQLPCWLTYTNEKTHQIIRENLDRSPLYAGIIQGIGPRYCPSIEDKVVRFSDRTRHQVFLEPEGYDTHELYANGISTSLPQDVQEAIVHSINGLEHASILRYGYAIEYDFAPPTQLHASLETKTTQNLFLAGQINGTTGYEEAAGQGLLAGINAVLKCQGKEPFVLERSEAYLGVLIDDLVTRGVEEPYRMFTSRAEYRLILRSDNADLRLMDYGHRFGLISNHTYGRFERYRTALRERIVGKENPLPNPEELFPWTCEAVEQEAAIERKYVGYIAQQKQRVEKLKKMEEKRIPEYVDYDTVKNLLTETRDRLKKIRPRTLGQASRIFGVTPADVAILMVHIEHKGRHTSN